MICIVHFDLYWKYYELYYETFLTIQRLTIMLTINEYNIIFDS